MPMPLMARLGMMRSTMKMEMPKFDQFHSYGSTPFDQDDHDAHHEGLDDITQHYPGDQFMVNEQQSPHFDWTGKLSRISKFIHVMDIIIASSVRFRP